jgi:ion channel
MSGVLLTVVGVVLLVAVEVDVFMTVFSPSEYGGPLTLRLTRVIWRIARSLARGPGQHRALALAAPIMAVGTILFWIMLLIVGFGLIYLPWMDQFLVSPGHLRSPLVEAFYFSASTATTLSIGDLVPDLAWLRVLAPLETLAGVGLLTAVLQYILAISERAQDMATMALDIAVHFDEEHSPDTVLERIRLPEDAASWGQWCEQISRRLLSLWEAHTRYPILLYFHPLNESEALSTQLSSLLSLRRSVLRAPQRNPLAQHPGFLAMSRSLELYLVAIDHHFLPGRHQATQGPHDLEGAYQRLVKQTGYSGVVRGTDLGELERGPLEDHQESSKRSA